MKNKLKIIIGFVISIVFIYLAFKSVNFKEIITLIGSVKIGYIIISFLLSILALFIRSYRWKLIVNEKGSKYMHFFDATCIGLMTNNLLPFRIGDFAQAYFLSTKSGMSKARTISTVVMERLVDLMFPTSFIIIGSFFLLLPPQISKVNVIAFLLIIITVVVLLIRTQHSFLKLIEKIIPEGKLREKIVSLVDNFFKGVKSINDRKTLAGIFVLSLIVWTLYIISTWLALKAFNIDYINFLQTAVVMAITCISVAIPSSPGYVGTWEFFTILSLSIFKVKKTLALSYALVNHFISWLSVVLLGIIVLIKNGISLAQIENAQTKSESSKEQKD
jgi:hypothetical protein